MHGIGVDVGTNLAHATGIACNEEGRTYDTRAFISCRGEDLNLRPSGYELSHSSVGFHDVCRSHADSVYQQGQHREYTLLPGTTLLTG